MQNTAIKMKKAGKVTVRAIGYRKYYETFFNEKTFHEYLFKLHYKNDFVYPICRYVEHYLDKFCYCFNR